MPFWQGLDLKGQIARQRRWRRVEEGTCAFATTVAVKKWKRAFRVIVFRKKVMHPTRKAIDLEDAAGLRLQAHTLKGSASVFMAQATVDAALRLEQMGRNGDISGAEEAWAALVCEVDRLVPVLKDRDPAVRKELDDA